MTALNELSLSAVAALIERREISAEALTAACLARIAAREPAVQAFEHLDPEAALAQAQARDAGPHRGPLHAIPLGIKDVIDTADMPTAWGSPIYAGKTPLRDAGIVALARAAGAVIPGKTVTTEFACFHPGKTRNPHDPAHTPGGSSMGSAAAVADCMLPLAFGTQTAGSVTRPAAYCGVVGYKASQGAFDLGGICALSQSVDSLGVFVREVRDLFLLRRAYLGEAAPAPRADDDPPRIGFVRTPHWREVAAEARARIEAAASALAKAGAVLREIEIGPADGALTEAHKTVMGFEVARSRAYEYFAAPDRMSDAMRGLIEAGMTIAYADYRAALALAAHWRRRLAETFAAVDLLLAPSAAGEAPAGLASTGDPLFSRMWTLLLAPSIALPAGLGPGGLPLGFQLIGPYGEDGALLRDADWVARRLA